MSVANIKSSRELDRLIGEALDDNMAEAIDWIDKSTPE